ncbi:MAG: hypothetical protein ACFCA4_12555 [Cyanophyceae cyanobacterium]
MKVRYLNGGLEIESYKLLVIEGSEIYFEFINDLLEKSRIYLDPSENDSRPREFRVDRCKAIAGAIAKLGDRSKQYDAVLVSNRSRIRAKKGAMGTLIRDAGTAPVLLLTTLGDRDDDIRQCLEAGVVAHIAMSTLRYQGGELLAHSVLDAIALRRGEFAKEESRAEAVSKKARKARKIQQGVGIFLWGVVVFVVIPSFRNGGLTVDFAGDKSLENFFAGAGTVLSVDLGSRLSGAVQYFRRNAARLANKISSARNRGCAND